MATKRSHEDVDGDDFETDNHQRKSSRNDDDGPAAKRIKSYGKGRHKANEGTIEHAKKRARAIERLFKRNQDLPADVRNDMERELAAHKETVADKSFQKKRTAMISKYHMVRFFERKKAMRTIKQLKSKIAKTTDEDELARLQKELHIAEVDEAYSMYHPHAEPYLSLYTKTKDGEDEEKTSGETSRPPLWATVEKTMEEGHGALKRLQERRSAGGATTADKKKGAQNKERAKRPEVKKPAKPTAAAQTGGNQQGKAPAMNRRERRRLMHLNAKDKSEDEDDGEGFFE